MKLRLLSSQSLACAFSITLLAACGGDSTGVVSADAGNDAEPGDTGAHVIHDSSAPDGKGHDSGKPHEGGPVEETGVPAEAASSDSGSDVTTGGDAGHEASTDGAIIDGSADTNGDDATTEDAANDAIVTGSDGGDDAGNDAAASDGGTDGGAEAGTDGGSDAGGDAGGNFACLGKPLPTVAADPITLSGTTQAVSTGGTSTLGGVALSLFSSSGTSLQTTASSNSGAFSFNNVSTGGSPADDYIEGTKATYVTTYVYPPSPFVANASNLPVLLFSTETEMDLQFIGITQSATEGFIGLRVVDCAGQALEGAVVEVKQAGTKVGEYAYTGMGGFPSTAATSTGSDGAAYIFNVPTGDSTLSAKVDGKTLRAHVVKSFANSLTTSVISP